jgi:hypothetical protein
MLPMPSGGASCIIAPNGSAKNLIFTARMPKSAKPRATSIALIRDGRATGPSESVVMHRYYRTRTPRFQWQVPGSSAMDEQHPRIAQGTTW